MGWWQNIWVQRAKDWTYAQLSPDQVPSGGERKAIPPNEYYVSIFLRSMRVVNVREGLAKFYGAVHSYVSLPHLSGIGQFQTVITPAALRNLDVIHLDRVVSVNHRLLGPVPYRGGDLELEIGLFSVKSSDLAGPFLTILEELASIAGVSFIPVAQPFVQPLLRGISLLVSSQGENVLEVGVTRTFDKLETGEILVMRAPKETANLASMRLDKNFRLVNQSGQPIGNYPYIVLGIEAATERDDWFQIPELMEAYNLLSFEIRRDKIPSITEAWANFQRVARTCPDLMRQDAGKLVEKKVKPIVDEVLSPTSISTRRREIPELAELDLYDRVR